MPEKFITCFTFPTPGANQYVLLMALPACFVVTTTFTASYLPCGTSTSSWLTVE